MTKKTIMVSCTSQQKGLSRHHEANISAESPETGQHPWFQKEVRNQERTRCAAGTARKGQATIEPLGSSAHIVVERKTFPRAVRLLDAAQFRRVFAHPTESSDGLFRVLAIPNDVGYARLGLAISKRCARRAVERNRIKRIVRESFRAGQAAVGSLDLVVLCRVRAVTHPNADLFRSLQVHWARLRKRCHG